jgi:hypothetical protein
MRHPDLAVVENLDEHPRAQPDDPSKIATVNKPETIPSALSLPLALS